MEASKIAQNNGIDFPANIDLDIQQLLIRSIELLPDGFVILDDNQQLVFCNQRYLDIYKPISDTWTHGTNLQKIAYDTAQHCIGINDKNELNNWVKQRLTTWGKSDHWAEQKFKNGHCIRTGETRLPNGWSVGIRTDITALKTAETKQKQSETRFRDFAESGADWFWELDANLHFHYASNRLQTITEIQVSSLIGVNIKETSLFKDSLNQSDVKALIKHLHNKSDFRDLTCKLKLDDNTTRVLQISGKVLFDTSGTFLGYRGAARDITDAYLLSEQLAYDAIHDGLTGLINRKEFQKQLSIALKRENAFLHPHILCFLDLDRFKLINDSCGHAVGDDFLAQIATTIQQIARTDDTAARLGGDEFGLLLRNCKMDEAMHIAESMRQAIEALSFSWDNHTHKVSTSIGIVELNASIHSPTHALQSADIACYSAKNKGRNRISLYHQDDIDATTRRTEVLWVTRIHDAFDYSRFQLFFQTILPMDVKASSRTTSPNRRPQHFELLLRMLGENGEIITPGEFLSAVEHFGLCQRLDRWVLETALNWMQLNPDYVEHLELCTLNISGTSLSDERFLGFVTEQLEQNPKAASKLCIEITENAAIRNLSATAQFIKTLQKRGCRFALDDFGKGFSSFSYLKHLPVDILKIDGGFVLDLMNSDIDKAVVTSIVNIAKALNLKSIAEWVETPELLLHLKEMGIDYAQGYAISKPKALSTLSD